MSRGEETDEPNTGGGPAVPGQPLDLGKPDPEGQAPEPGPRFAVVISGDGSAAIDGEPVPAREGTTVDAAILDVLHGYARDLATTVTATISDPSAGYVAYVEVAPDGSSTLLDQREQQEPAPVPVTAPVPVPEYAGAPTEEPEAAADVEINEADETDEADEDPGAYEDEDENEGEVEDGDGDEDADYDVGTYTAEDPHHPTPEPRAIPLPLPPPPPAPNAPSSSYTYTEYMDDEDEDEDHPEAGAEADDEAEEETAFGADAGTGPGAGPGGDFGEARSPEAAPSRPAPQLVRRPGARQSDDEYEGPGLLHRPLVVGPMALIVAALVIVPLVILGSGGSDDGGHRTEAARSSAETKKSPQAGKPGPISTSSPSLPPTPSASASASPSAKPEKSKKPKETKKPADPRNGGGVVVTITARPPQATVTAKPPQDTAASAVRRLAKNDPSGRHICYRAYVSGQGWQKPVCDGTMAGTTKQNRAIKALNIAVSGSGGSAANAFVHNPASKDGRGKWMPSWTAIKADGTNNYIGSTKKGAPNMSGFAINIGKGRICQTAKVHSFDWGGQGCADARPGYVFGGALENDRYLEAVKFTV
ncbi:hypothetical protein AB0912_10405 [Streptomyces sp. NPDC007084]|uniref:hypothetical protein n=1 Tax=Streptomyces sp. NPDC007084 TaxID=3154313 RepID=UPI0034531506